VLVAVVMVMVMGIIARIVPLVMARVGPAELVAGVLE
jgi:hypothetical protein